MPAPMLRPADVAQRLNIPASTLRRWSFYFADYLPTHVQEANGAATRSHRRYSEEDVRVLTQIKELLGRGLTYEEVGLHLAEQTSDPEQTGDSTVVEVLAETIESSDVGGQSETEGVSASTERRAIVNQPDETDNRPELANLIAETLFSLSDSQQIILSGQQTSRQLLGVVLQDNFNLKEENSRLRERILEAERKLFELKREVDSNQTQDRERMRQMESYLFELQRRLDSLAPQVMRHASPAAGAKPTPAPVAASAPVAAPPAAAVAPAAQAAPAPQAAPPPAAVYSGAAVASSPPPTAVAGSPTAAPPAIVTPAEASYVPPPPPAPTPPPVQAAAPPADDETEPISPFAPPRTPSAQATPVVTAQPEAAIATPPPASPPPSPPPETIIPVAPAAAVQPAVPPPAPASSGRWQRFNDWLFGRNMEE